MKTVLLVENEEVLRNLVKELLEIKGYQVLQAVHGADALGLLQTHNGRIDLVLTDVNMPQMSGSELAEHVRRDHPTLKVIFISGAASAENPAISKFLETPGAAFIQKPFRLSALVSQVEQLLVSGE